MDISMNLGGSMVAPWVYSGNKLVEKSNNKSSLPSKIPYKPIPVGTKIEVLGPNGGGYGSQSERDPEMIKSDLENEIITEKTAKEKYNLLV